MAIPIPKSKRQSPSHQRSKRQETEIAKRTGGHKTPGSGSKNVKGDVRLKSVLRVEAKTTKNSSFSVTVEHLDKIESAVSLTTEVPCMCVELELGRKKFWVIPDSYMEEIIEIIKCR